MAEPAGPAPLPAPKHISPGVHRAYSEHYGHAEGTGRNVPAGKQNLGKMTGNLTEGGQALVLGKDMLGRGNLV